MRIIGIGNDGVGEEDVRWMIKIAEAGKKRGEEESRCSDPMTHSTASKNKQESFGKVHKQEILGSVLFGSHAPSHAFLYRKDGPNRLTYKASL